jgi:hypothetical protein
VLFATQTMRQAFPQFDETSPETGKHMQQDADECLGQVDCIDCLASAVGSFAIYH